MKTFATLALLLPLLSLLSLTQEQTVGGSKTVGTSQVMTVPPPALTILNTSLSPAIQNSSYNAALQAQNGTKPYFWSISVGSLPTGINLNSSGPISYLGLLSGTPTVVGLVNFTVKVTDNLGATATKPLSINVVAPSSCGPPTFPCARTDFQCPNGFGTTNCTLPTIPNIGGVTGANTVYTDPYFGTVGVRVTDANFDAANASYVTVASGSSEETMFNADDTKLWLQATGTAGYPVAMVAAGTYTGSVNTSGTSVTYVSGTNFNWAWFPPGTAAPVVTINGSASCTLAAITSDTTLTCTTSQGTQTGVTFSITITAALQTARIYNTGSVGTGFKQLAAGLATGSGGWSHGDRCTFSTIFGTQIWNENFCGITPPAATPTTACSSGSPSNPCILYDYSAAASCLGNAYVPSWGSFGGISKFPADTLYSGAFSNSGSGQGTGVDVAAYLVGSGCSHLITGGGSAWTVTGDWGSTGSVSYNNTGSPPAFSFKIHNVKAFYSGSNLWMRVDYQASTCVGTCDPNPLFWKVGTTLVYQATISGNGSGHQCMGTNNFYNNFGNPIGNYAKRDTLGTSPNFDFLTTNTPMIPSSTGCYLGTSPIDLCYPPGSGGKNALTPTIDAHCSGEDSDAGDTIPIADSTSDAGQYFGSYPAALYNEIRLLAVDGSGRIYREGSCFMSGQSQIFDAWNCTLSVSGSGKYVEFTSDWMCQLGTTSGGAAPSNGCAPNWVKSTVYALNAQTVPNVSNPCAFVYQATSGGTSGTGNPIFNSKPCSNTGTVNTSGTAVTWVSGTKFSPNWVGSITVNGGGCTISGAPTTTSLTCTATQGTNSGVAYSAPSVTIGDGSVVWTSQGLPNGRSEVILLQLR